MGSLISTLFSGRERYLSDHIANLNYDHSFPIHNKISYDEFFYGMGDESLLVSGGSDEERSLLLLNMIKRTAGKIVVLHNGNRFLKAENIIKCGMHAEEWDGNIYKGMNKAQMLSLLSGEKRT